MIQALVLAPRASSPCPLTASSDAIVFRAISSLPTQEVAS